MNPSDPVLFMLAGIAVFIAGSAHSFAMMRPKLSWQLATSLILVGSSWAYLALSPMPVIPALAVQLFATFAFIPGMNWTPAQCKTCAEVAFVFGVAAMTGAGVLTSAGPLG